MVTRRLARRPATTLGLLCISIVAACAAGERHRRVSPADFAQLAASPIGSARHVEWIGIAGDRAFLSVWTVASSSARARVDVVSCAVADLAPDLLARLRAEAPTQAAAGEYQALDHVECRCATPPSWLP